MSGASGHHRLTPDRAMCVCPGARVSCGEWGRCSQRGCPAPPAKESFRSNRVRGRTGTLGPPHAWCRPHRRLQSARSQLFGGSEMRRENGLLIRSRFYSKPKKVAGLQSNRAAAGAMAGPAGAARPSAVSLAALARGGRRAVCELLTALRPWRTVGSDLGVPTCARCSSRLSSSSWPKSASRVVGNARREASRQASSRSVPCLPSSSSSSSSSSSPSSSAFGSTAR